MSSNHDKHHTAPVFSVRAWLAQGWRWLARTSMLLLAAGSIVMFGILASIRLVYPFELEWIEGGFMDHVRWVAAGNPLYPEPSVTFIPLNKTPVFFIVSALLTHLTGMNFVAPRLVSILATLGSFILIFAVVHYQTRSIVAGIVAAGLYAAAFRLTGAWMDIAQTDALYLFFIILAFWIAQRYGESFAGLLLSGLVYGLAYYTKQVALPVIVMMAAYSLLVSRGRTWLPWTLSALTGLGVFWLLDWTSGGWFSYYTFDMVVYNRRVADIWRLWWLLLEHSWPLLLLGLLVLALTLIATGRFFRVPAAERPAGRPLIATWGFLMLAGGLLGSSWSVFLQRWTYNNGLMPVMIGLALLAGVAVGGGGLLQAARLQRLAPLLGVLVPLLVVWQFVLLAYHPQEQLPTAQDRLAGEQLVEQLASLSGDVLVFSHGFVAHMAGKPPHLHSSPLSDAIGWGSYPVDPDDDDNAWRREYIQHMWERAVHEGVFDWVILDRHPEEWLPYYLTVGRLDYPHSHAFYPVTGARTRPNLLLVRNPLVKGGTVYFANPQSDYLTGSGWSRREAWGRWSDGPYVTLKIALEQQDHTLAVEAFPFCYDDFERQRITVYWNDYHLDTVTYSDCASQVVHLDVPAASITTHLDELRIEFENTTAPSDVGAFNDNRQLGLGFVALTVEPSNDR